MISVDLLHLDDAGPLRALVDYRFVRTFSKNLFPTLLRSTEIDRTILRVWPERRADWYQSTLTALLGLKKFDVGLPPRRATQQSRNILIPVLRLQRIVAIRRMIDSYSAIAFWGMAKYPPDEKTDILGLRGALPTSEPSGTKWLFLHNEPIRGRSPPVVSEYPQMVGRTLPAGNGAGHTLRRNQRTCGRSEFG